jgi:hypothetical protein
VGNEGSIRRIVVDSTLAVIQSLFTDEYLIPCRFGPTGRILSMLRLDPEGVVKFTDMLTFECPWEADLAFYLLSYRLAYMEVNRAVQVRGLLSNVGFL